MAKFKLGQKIRIVKKTTSNQTGQPDYAGADWQKPHTFNGLVGFIQEIVDDGRYIVYGKLGEESTYLGYYEDSEIELITDYQPITPKVGERYRVLKEIECWHKDYSSEENLKHYPIGSIVTVDMVDNQTNDHNLVSQCGKWEWAIHKDCFTTEYLELVEDDIKEVVTNAFNVSMDITYGTGRVGDIDGNYVGDLANCPVFVTQEPNQTLLTKTKNYMTNLYRRAKLSANEKVLLKAGYINDDGTPTTKGSEASNFLQFKANEAELVKMAEADLAEEKE